ncbi:hypothetical protein [Hydrogenophaga sp.]|uniref:hypothetical protein n=1 Tax=Hydrogenophaga sp. TaxID=1904254 RepID=UPI00271C9B98|nr:hypothetical protein [Hydrogenophaga sp.]MDO9134243.1 hypothetical protein [Hydrogenophaga sp.]
MNNFITDPLFENRLRRAVTEAWAAFGRKVGGGLIPVNKEASMQLQYAFVLKQLLPLALHHPDEWADVELETGVRTTTGTNNIDILLKGASSAGEVKIGIELKCYRTIAASGRTRGAHDIFMKDVYEDLHVLEEYVSAGIVSRGVALVMNDLPRFVQPVVKNGKCWAYDISHGFTFPGGKINVPVGGKVVNVDLQKSYCFDWKKFGGFWFAELEGVSANSAASASITANVQFA